MNKDYSQNNELLNSISLKSESLSFSSSDIGCGRGIPQLNKPNCLQTTFETILTGSFVNFSR
jgi:hypothetical protein